MCVFGHRKSFRFGTNCGNCASPGHNRFRLYCKTMNLNCKRHNRITSMDVYHFGTIRGMLKALSSFFLVCTSYSLPFSVLDKFSSIHRKEPIPFRRIPDKWSNRKLIWIIGGYFTKRAIKEEPGARAHTHIHCALPQLRFYFRMGMIFFPMVTALISASFLYYIGRSNVTLHTATDEDK